MGVLVFHQRNRAGILVFHPNSGAWYLGVSAWKTPRDHRGFVEKALRCPRSDPSWIPKIRGLSGASWNRQGTILGKQRRLEDYSTS